MGWQHLEDSGLITASQHRALKDTGRDAIALEWVPEDTKGVAAYDPKQSEGMVAEPMSVATMAWSLIRSYMPREGMARAMARFAAAPDGSAETRLHQAMRLHPDLVAGETRACTNLMRAMDGKVALKTGAEGLFIAILPEQKLGVALKAACGTKRAAECAITSILIKLGALAENHPEALKYRNAPIENRRNLITGHIRPATSFS